MEGFEVDTVSAGEPSSHLIVGDHTVINEINNAASTPPQPAHHKAFHSIRTSRLLVRSCLPIDAQAICNLVRSPESNPYDPPSKTATPEKLAQHIAEWTASSARGENGFMTIVLLPESEHGKTDSNSTNTDDRDLGGYATGKVIGIGGFNSFEYEPATDGSETKVLVADIGSIIDHEYWRKGYGAEAMAATIDYGFDSLGVDYIFMGTIVENTPWRSMMSGKFGLEQYQYEDTMPGGPSKGKPAYMWKFNKANWRDARERISARSA